MEKKITETTELEQYGFKASIIKTMSGRDTKVGIHASATETNGNRQEKPSSLSFTGSPSQLNDTILFLKKVLDEAMTKLDAPNPAR